MVNQERLWQRLMTLAEIGRQPDGGITRLSFSPEERAAKDTVRRWMEEAGLSVREDAVGNLIGRRSGQQNDGPVVLTGSHLDSVYNGGNFDGPLGVLAALEAVQCMQETGVETALPVEVVAFTDEEGARFRFGMIGSRGLAGTLTADHLEAVDANGVRIRDAMTAVGLNPDDIGQAARSSGSVAAYVEVHIEQGTVLERANLPVGVVSGIAGPLWLKFSLRGQAGHAGTTAMDARRDALVGAAAIIQEIEAACRQEVHTVGTVGQLTVEPGGVNIIPGQVEFTLDLRDVDAAVRTRVEQRIRTVAARICADRQLDLSIAVLQDIAPVRCDERIQAAIRTACAQVGLSPLTVVSGAGHDGMQLQHLCPIGMIFVRSKDGVSHHPAEWSSPEDCAAGAEVLYHTLLQLSQG
ncbi:Zn-dependent hydrolase [Alicyclobacillus contaminans]|uniref:Zn-dependent hydrolase n=1 Tax=Alicyclobacillus contaminans TaxID=392016 RepID=UPI0004291AF9|nr:Zn-dependent hydrolase [Alicyclobacillus contaminans]GMA51405.1 Zn-dependent hydrolase [Alicyclobacillus contaminans]